MLKKYLAAKLGNSFDSAEEYQRFALEMIKQNRGSAVTCGRIAVAVEAMATCMILCSPEHYGSNMAVAVWLHAAMCAATAVMLLLIRWSFDDIEKHVHTLKIYQEVYRIFMLGWAYVGTILNTRLDHSVTVLIFIICITFFPLVLYIRSDRLIISNLMAVAAVIMIGAYCGESFHDLKEVVNSIIFIMLATATGVNFNQMRVRQYKQKCMLEQKNKQLQNLADIDFLSQLYNRNKLYKISEKLWQEGMVQQKAVGCFLCDIDNFKQVNDTYGHLEGDYWIRHVAEVILKATEDRESYCFRYGGEEFMVMVPDTSYDEMMAMGERIRLAASKEVEGKDYTLTLSGGIYLRVPQNGESINDLFKMADQALYVAKGAGKNRIRTV